MKKVAVISICDECPHFNNEYYSYEETCELLNRKIKSSCKPYNEYDTWYEIPDDCPLDNYEEKI